MSVSRRLLRLLESALAGRLPARKRSELVAHLRSDDALRQQYDRAIDAFRALEGRDVARVEYDLVEEWLFDGGAVTQVAEPSHASWLRFVGVIVALAAGLVLALGPLRPKAPDESDVFTPKNGAGAPSMFAIQALCPGGGGLVPASELGCELADTVSFAYRLDLRASVSGALTLFAVDEHGDVLYYQPTPVDVEPVRVVPGAWQPLPIAVELAVNHEAGEVTLYGLVSATSPTIEEIDEAGELLANDPPARVGDPPWHERLRGRGRIGSMCAPLDTCESAELSFYIHEDAR